MALNKKRELIVSRRGYTAGCRMPGVWRALAHSEGALVIFHGPRACAHVAREMDLGDYYRTARRHEFLDFTYSSPLLSSNLRDEHAIFGGEEQLARCIDYAVQKYAPQYIVIASSCVAGTIGDDVEAVAGQASDKHGIPVLAVPGSGFLDGEYYGGFYHTAQLLIDTFMEKQLSPKTTAVTLLGERGGKIQDDAAEIQQMLGGFGLTVNYLFPGYISLKEMNNIPSSALAIPLGGRGRSYLWTRRLAEYLGNKFDIPFLAKEYPVGRAETTAWLLALGVLLRQEELAASLVKIQERRLLAAAEKNRGFFQGLKAVLCIGRPPEFFQPEWIFELIGLLNIHLTGIILFQELLPEQKNDLQSKLKNCTETIVLAEKDAGELMRQADFLVTTHALENETKKQFHLPYLSPLGIGGLIKVMEKMAYLAKKDNTRSNIVYGW